MNHLFISNFGPVKQADLNLKSVNLLIGEQSIGKSTIAKLIAIFTDNASLAVIAGSGIKSWNGRLRMYDLSVYSQDDYHIKYEYGDAHCHLTISITRKRVLSSLILDGEMIKDKKRIGEQIVKMRKMFHADTFMDVLLSEIKALNNKENVKYQILSLQSLIESSLYVPAERIAFSMYDNLKSAFSLIGEATSYTFRRFIVSLDKAKSIYKNYNSSLLKITYLNEEEGQFFIDTKSNKKYRFYNASSGIQSTIPLLLVLEDIKNREYTSIVIEEPETNLYPSTQVETLKLILQKARVDGRIVTITTHSPYLLSAMNNYLYAGSIARNLSKSAKASLDGIVPPSLQLNFADCSVYSIGESINDEGVYCASILDEKIGMIDANTLDKISFSLSQEFSSIQDILLSES